jgi:hypothetical protein
VIVGDSNMSETTTLLKIGSTDLVLRMIEARPVGIAGFTQVMGTRQSISDAIVWKIVNYRFGELSGSFVTSPVFGHHMFASEHDQSRLKHARNQE